MRKDENMELYIVLFRVGTVQKVKQKYQCRVEMRVKISGKTLKYLVDHSFKLRKISRYFYLLFTYNIGWK